MNHKRLRRVWKRKTHTGFFRPRRISRRAIMRLQARMVKADLPAQIAGAGQDLAELPRISEV